MDRIRIEELTLTEAVEKLREVLSEYTACTVTVFTHKDAGYEKMPEDCVVISVKEGESELFIELDSQIVVSYKWWHRHYSFDTDDQNGGFHVMLDDLHRILRCETYQFVLFGGERWLGTSHRCHRLETREQINEAAARELVEYDWEGGYALTQREIWREISDLALMRGVEWDVIRRLGGSFSEMSAEAAALAGIDIGKTTAKYTAPRPVLPDISHGLCVRCVYWDKSLDSKTDFDTSEVEECLSRLNFPG